MRRRRYKLLLLVLVVAISSTSASTSSAPLPPPTKTKKSLIEAKLPITSRSTNGNTTTSDRTDYIKVAGQLPASQLNGSQPIRVDSKTGKLLARMQGKRQANAADAPSRRNEDPWFLDQTPYPLQPYRFVYNIKGKNGQTEQYRQEVGDGKFLTGSYGYVLPDGIYRHVDYIADDRGFRAFIRTSEPGTANQNPANVVINATPVVQPPGQIYSSYRPPDPLPGPLPTASFGPSLGGTDLSAYTGGGGSSLAERFGPEVRRPPGSIVNGALSPTTNFTSFASPLPAPASFQPLPPANFGYRPPSSDFSLGPAQVSRFGGAANQSASSLGSSEPTTINNNNWPTYGNSLSDELAFARISKQRQSLLEPSFQATQGGGGGGGGRDQEPRRPAEGSRFGSGSSGTPSIDRITGQRLTYDTPLSVQGGNFGPNKLTYDNNHVFHPSLPFLTYERARSLAQIDQLNALNPSYIRPLQLSLPSSSSSSASAAAAASGLESGFGLLQPARHFSSGHSTTHSKQEEHHHRHQVTSSTASNSQQPKDEPPEIKEHRTGSGSVREFEHHQTISHGLQPPPQPTFSGQSTFQSPPSPLLQDTKTNGGVKGGGSTSSGNPARLLAPPYASLSQQQQQQNEEPQHTETGDGHTPEASVKGGGGGGPREPSQPVEPRRPLQPETITSSTGPEQQGSVKGGVPSSSSSSSSSSGVNEREKRRPQESPFAWYNNLGEDSLIDQSKPSFEQQQQQLKSSSSLSGAPVRSIRMPGDMDFRSTILMNDLRSMQNMIGLPQPPRLNRLNSSSSGSPENPFLYGRAPLNGVVEDQHQFGAAHGPLTNRATNLIHHSSSLANERLNGGLTAADRIVSARMTRLEALMERAGQLQRSQQQQQQQQQQHQNSSSPSAAQTNRAASNQLASLAQLESPLAASGKQKVPQENDLRRSSSGGPVLKKEAKSLNEFSLEDNLVKAANETFDARRLSQAAKRLQAEKVSELEKFQQRLRAQQLFLTHSKSESQPQNAKPLLTLNGQPKSSSSSSSSSARSGNEPMLNSHVKYDEDNATENPPGGHPHLPGSQLLKPQLFKSLEPSSNGALARDFPRIRRQPDGDSSSLDQPARSVLPKSENLTAAILSRVGDDEHRQQQRQRKLTILQTNETASNKGVGGGGHKVLQKSELSEFARQIQQWPSVVTGQIETNSSKLSVVDAEVLTGTLDQSTTGGADGPPTLPVAGIDKNKQQSNQTVQQQQQQPNMNFLNSIASLSAHQLNPFSSASVNLQPQQQQQQQQPEQLHPRDSSSNSHKDASSSSSRPTITTTSSPTSSRMGVATSSARYFSSPELLAALDFHEQRDTSGRLRDVLPKQHAEHQSTGAAEATLTSKQAPEPTTLVSWASNHRYHRSAGAPYDATRNHQPAIIAAAADSTNQAPESDRAKKASHQVSSNQQQPTNSPRTSSSGGLTSRDGFDIRDRSLQVDDERFYEVVSSGPASSNNNAQSALANEHHGWGGQFQAFKDAQLSIPAVQAAS